MLSSVNIVLESAFTLIQKIAQKSPPKTTLYLKSHQKIANKSFHTLKVLQIILPMFTQKRAPSFRILEALFARKRVANLEM